METTVLSQHPAALSCITPLYPYSGLLFRGPSRFSFSFFPMQWMQ
jgi:hypothetical protein